MKKTMQWAVLMFVAAASTLSVRSLGETVSYTESEAAADAKSNGEDVLYAKGTSAMDEQRWADALTAFDGVIAAKGKRVEAATYWKAYSLNKLGRKEEAAALCGQLRGEHPSSTWVRECVALQAGTLVDGREIARMAREQVELGMETARAARLQGSEWTWTSDNNWSRKHATTEDDIKLLALNSLMRQDPAKALPMLRETLKSTKPLEIRKQALFILSRGKTPEAQAALMEAATNKGDVELQREAVQILALNRGKDAGPTLLEIYRGSTDAKIKRAALNGLYLAHDAPRLVELARAEKDLNMKRDIVSQLALMKDPAATDYMLELLK